MKKKFEYPEIEIVKFSTERVLEDLDSSIFDFDDPNAGEWA